MLPVQGVEYQGPGLYYFPTGSSNWHYNRTIRFVHRSQSVAWKYTEGDFYMNMNYDLYIKVLSHRQVYYTAQFDLPAPEDLPPDIVLLEDPDFRQFITEAPVSIPDPANPTLVVPVRTVVTSPVPFVGQGSELLSSRGNARPALPLNSRPLVGRTYQISTNPKARLATSPHFLRPPGRGTKERKLRVTGASAALLVVGGVTEAADFVDALWRAIPLTLRDRHATLTRKIEQIYAHYEEIKLADFIHNYLVDSAKDAAYAAFGLLNQHASAVLKPHGNLPIGFAAGPAL